MLFGWYYESSLSECHYVQKVLARLSEYNVKVNESKYKFFKKSVEFLGYEIDSHGIHPLADKIESTEKAPSKSYSTKVLHILSNINSLLNYYGKFIPMLSARLKPFYDLCGNSSVKFYWLNECERVF